MVILRPQMFFSFLPQQSILTVCMRLQLNGIIVVPNFPLCQRNTLASICCNNQSVWTQSLLVICQICLDIWSFFWTLYAAKAGDALSLWVGEQGDQKLLSAKPLAPNIKTFAFGQNTCCVFARISSLQKLTHKRRGFVQPFDTFCLIHFWQVTSIHLWSWYTAVLCVIPCVTLSALAQAFLLTGMPLPQISEALFPMVNNQQKLILWCHFRVPLKTTMTFVFSKSELFSYASSSTLHPRQRVIKS